ncbi:hypothetical protein Baya_6173 [Bagarius yarrelli]|uniref:Uncharacterized protein n=1 Tax=Bagarius yarrelli TaxID=175774 RepID=A0A556U572_BAGYA|nr:hypothetical protein Baya_6173 [Bagarius yarrelli]
MSLWINIDYFSFPTGAEKCDLASSALPYNQGDDERAMLQDETRLDPVLLKGLPSGHASRWHITDAGGCG